MSEYSVFDIPVGDQLIIDSKTFINKGFVTKYMPTIGRQKVLKFVTPEHDWTQLFYRGIPVIKTSLNGIWRAKK